MAISKVRVQINGVWTNASLNSAGQWTCSPTAPDITSYNQSGGYYSVAVEITNDAGTTVTYNAASSTIGNSLRLIVKEIVKPIITLVSPTNGTLSRNNKQAIVFKVTDETSGSGVNRSSVELTLDGTKYKVGSAGMAVSDITNGYQFTYTPQNALSDGSHNISITAADNDGNVASTVSASFKIDTTKPVLTISSPAEGLITNKAAVTLSGTTNDATSSPVSVTAKLNGVDVGSITLASNGSFSKALTLSEGSNTIEVTSSDSAGNTTTITRNVKLDTSVPKLNSVSINPNPVNASGSVQVTLVIT